MTESEAREIIDRYEALVTAVTGEHRDDIYKKFDCPLEIEGGRIVAMQTERREPEDGWFPQWRAKDLDPL